MAKTDTRILKRLIGRYGADPRRWPQDAAAHAPALAERARTDADLARALADERALDALLSSVPEPKVDTARVDTVLALALRDIAVLTHEAARPPAPSRHHALNTSPWHRLWQALGGGAATIKIGGGKLGEWARMGWLAGATAAGLALGMITLPQPALQSAATTAPATATTIAGADTGDTLDAPSLLFSPYAVDTLGASAKDARR